MQWVFSAVIGKYIENYFMIVKCKGLPWSLGKTKQNKKLLKVELWFWIPSQFNVIENIISTYKHKKLLTLIMFSFLSEVSLEHTLRPIKIYRKMLHMEVNI